MRYPDDRELQALLDLYVREGGAPPAPGDARRALLTALRAVSEAAYDRGRGDSETEQSKEWQAVAEQMKALERVTGVAVHIDL